MNEPTRLSIVSPAYCCAGCIPELYRRIKESIQQIQNLDFELILINDGSPENDWAEIQLLTSIDTRVKGINLSRNFGQHRAISAGIEYCSGDWIVVMDCDLQDRPEEIQALLMAALSGDYDVVFAQRISRQDPRLKVALSRVFYWLLNHLSTIPIDSRISSFSIAKRNVVEHYRSLKEGSHSYGLGILWCGFKVGYLPVQHGSRFTGDSTYTLARSMNLALEAITSLSNKPLSIAIRVGFIMAATAFIYGCFLILRYLFWAIPVEGWTSILVSIYFLAGIMLAFLGILGLYLGKVFDEVKGRPKYIIRESLNLDQQPPKPTIRQ